MQSLNILNSKEKKLILNKLKEHFGIKELDLDYVFFKSNEGKIFLLNNDVSRLNLDKLRVNSLGLYFGVFENNFRLSIEGSQLIGDKVSKNVVELDDPTKWLEGEDINVNEENGLKLVKSDKIFLGSGQLKDGVLINYIPKERRIK